MFFNNLYHSELFQAHPDLQSSFYEQPGLGKSLPGPRNLVLNQEDEAQEGQECGGHPSGRGPETGGDTASGGAKKGGHFLFQRETDQDSDHLRRPL